MKVRLFVGLSAVALVVAALAFSAKTFRATAQDKPPTPSFDPIPGRQLVPPMPPPSAFPPPTAPATTAQLSTGVVQANAPAPAQESSLAELIANLKELRKQEQQLTKAIKEKIKAQKRSIDDAESELKSLSIDFANGGPPPNVPPAYNNRDKEPTDKK